MKIAVLGAAGRTGRVLISAAHARGHKVIGIARSPEKIETGDAVVEPRRGDAFDRDSIIRGLEGAEAVITTVGKTDLRDKRYNLSTVAHRHVVEAMKQHGIRRLLAISSVGAAQGVKRKGIRRNLYLYFRRKYYGDMFQMENEVIDSGLDATVVRAPMLHNKSASGTYRVLETEDYEEALSISRGDLANFLFDELEKGTWTGKTVAVVAADQA